MVETDKKVDKNLERINALSFKKSIDKRIKKFKLILQQENERLLESGNISKYNDNCLILNGVNRVQEMMYYIGLETKGL